MKKKKYVIMNSKGRYLYINIENLKKFYFWQSCFIWKKDVKKATMFDDNHGAGVWMFNYATYTKDTELIVTEIWV